jgi:hypothetical protein
MKTLQLKLKDSFSGCTDIKSITVDPLKEAILKTIMENNQVIKTHENNITFNWIIIDIIEL